MCSGCAESLYRYITTVMTENSQNFLLKTVSRWYIFTSLRGYQDPDLGSARSIFPLTKMVSSL